MKRITVSAPGKLMLFGEHAVVYNKPCLVTAIDQRMRLTIEVIKEPELQLNASAINVFNYKKHMSRIGKGSIPKGAKFVEVAVKNFLDISAKKNLSRPLRTYPNPPLSGREAVVSSSLDKGRLGGVLGIKITTKSEFSSRYGFGSSAASVVCTIKALSELLKLKLTSKEIFNLAYQTVLDVQGSGSGFDVASAVYGGTIYFKAPGKIIDSLAINHLPLIVAYSGIKADTVTLINQVKEKKEKEPSVVENIYNEIQEIVEKAKNAIITQNWEETGLLMNKNQKLLFWLGVSTPKLNNMIASAVKAGAYGAKLSGAGGGDCIIALSDKKKKEAVEKAIETAGGKIIKVKTNAEGVRVE